MDDKKRLLDYSSSDSGRTLLPPGYDRLADLDLKSGLPWIIPELIVPGEFVTLSDDPPARLHTPDAHPVVFHLASYWAAAVSSSRGVLYISREPERLILGVTDLAKVLKLDRAPVLSELDLISGYASSEHEDWEQIEHVVRHTSRRFVVVLRESDAHISDEVLAIRRITSLGASVMIVMNHVTSALADSADINLAVNPFSMGRFIVDVLKGEIGMPRRRSRDYQLVDSVWTARDGRVP